MPFFVILAIALVCQVPARVEAQAPAGGDAYLDAGAGVLVAGARAASDSANARITGYDAIARQRTTAGVRIIGRSRPVYRQEMAVRLAWRRGGPNQVEVLGAREAIPVARPGIFIGNDLPSDADDLLFDPTELFLLRTDRRYVPRQSDRRTAPDVDEEGREGETADDVDDDDGMDVELIHPFAAGSEEHYQFRTGEQTTIRLQDGRSIRLIELQVIPRRSTPRLLKGSFWLEEGSFSAVRGVFTLASPIRFSIPPANSRGPYPATTASFEIRHVAVEYGLWEDEWWMPSLVSFEGTGRIAGVTGSLIYEKLYGDYRVYSDDDEPPLLEEPDTVRFALHANECPELADKCVSQVVLIPRDTASILAGPYLPGSIYAEDERLADENTLREFAALIDAASFRAMTARSPRFGLTPFDFSLVHYNRVEGVTLGGTGWAELEPFAASLSLWLGHADPSPSGVLAIARTGYNRRETLDLYRRIEAFAPEDRPFSLGSSIGAFVFGRDEGDYYRSTGVSLSRSYGDSSAPGFVVRGYAESQRSVATSTNASIPFWIDERAFHANPAASEANQYGAEARVRYSRGLDPMGFRFSLDAGALAESGTYRFARGATNAYLSFPLPGRLVGAVEAGGGTSTGDVPVQRLWYVGGPGTVRGFAPAERVAGEAFWRTRAEIGTARPALRFILFSDAGNAAPRGDLGLEPALISVGAGVSTLDGLIRMDVGRAVRGGSGWSVRLKLDGAL